MAQEGSEPQMGSSNDCEECHHALVCSYTHLKYPSLARTEDSKSSRDFSSLLVQSHADEFPSGKTSERMERARDIQVKLSISLLTVQVNSKGLRQHFLIIWVKRKWLVTVSFTAEQRASVSANTTQNIQVTFKRLLWIFHSQRMLDEINGRQLRSLCMTYLAHFLPFLPLRLF